MTDTGPETHDRSVEYGEYYEGTRRPTGFGRRVLSFWHRRMLAVATHDLGSLRGRQVVEVGAGWGFFGNACLTAGVPYRGIEMNAAQAAVLRAAGLTVDAGAIPPFPVGLTADVVWLSHVLEHARDYQHAKAMLQACLETLTPGGHVVVIGPDLLSWREHFWDVDWSHGFPTTVQRVAQLMRDTGFSVTAARHHTATLTNPFLVWLVTGILALVPFRFIDAGLERLTGRTFAQSFMAVFGWRQILVIGQKPQKTY